MLKETVPLIRVSILEIFLCQNWAEFKKIWVEKQNELAIKTTFFKWPIDQKWTHNFSLFVIKVFLVWQVDDLMIFKWGWYKGYTCFLATWMNFLWAWREASLEEIHNSNSQYCLNILKYMWHHCYFRLLYFSLSLCFSLFI